MRRDDALAAIFSAIQHHLGELQVVGRARGQPAAARKEIRAFGDVGQRRPLTVRPALRLGQTRKVVGMHVEIGGIHVRRAGHMLGDVLVERLARHDLDDPSEHIDRNAVFPNLARLMGEGQLRQLDDKLRQRIVAVADMRFAIHLFPRSRRASLRHR